MRHDITPDTVAQVIYQQIICPSGDPREALTEWMDITSGLGCALGNWQRVAVGRPGYEAQTAALTQALLRAQDIMRCLARVA
ncbi:MAG TPA: hypothetical protein PLY96_16325 [Chromatiaceae bacterium]|nr:hypothetical protein [Chromatiaceae bacterium]